METDAPIPPLPLLSPCEEKCADSPPSPPPPVLNRPTKYDEDIWVTKVTKGKKKAVVKIEKSVKKGGLMCKKARYCWAASFQ